MLHKRGAKVKGDVKLSELDSCVLLLLKFSENKGIEDLSAAQINKAIYNLQVQSIKFTGKKFNEDVVYFRAERGPISKDVKDSLDRLISLGFVDFECKDIKKGTVRNCHKIKSDDIKLNLTQSQIIFATSTFRILEKKYPKFWDKKPVVQLGSYETEPMLEILEVEKKEKKKLVGRRLNFDVVMPSSDFFDIIGE